MAEAQSPGVNMADDHLATKLARGGKERRGAHRRWNCPAETNIAAYLDGSVTDQRRGRIESHLAKCAYCCGVVADVIKLQRTSLPDVPVGLVRSAIAFGSGKSRRWRWIFVPVAATAGAVLALVVTLDFRGPEQLPLSAPSAPAAPLIARSEPAPAPALRRPTGDLVRNSTATATLPRITSPKQDNVVAGPSLQFAWKPILKARYYEVHVVTQEGSLVWEGQSETSALKLPSDVSLGAGQYFVWVSAYLDDGRVQKSAPVRFLVRTTR